jgi:hypothetical protein
VCICRLSGSEWAYELGVVDEGDTATLFPVHDYAVACVTSRPAALKHVYALLCACRLSGSEWAYELGVVDEGDTVFGGSCACQHALACIT